MKIRLHGTILDEDSKKCEVMWFGESDAVSFKDLDEALASKADDDKLIELSINSPGGVCTEGMAIYDRLRSLEGHTIKAEVIGECSSMASVVLMAASVRRMHPNARICIHKPRFSDFYLPTMTEDEAKRAYEDLHAETERLKKIYLDRTSYTEEELDKLMGEDRYMTAEEALQHGVITEIIQPMTATKQPTHMSKLTKEDCILLLGDKYKKLREQGLSRYPQRSDFDDMQVVYIKAHFGPWPRALEEAGIKPKRSDDRLEKNREKRIRAKIRQREMKKAEKKGERSVE
jgi:ATP-dependent Clp protease protease subunit